MISKYKNSFSGNYFLSYRDNSDYTKAKIIIAPVGYQGTTSYGKGTIDGPDSIIDASYFMEPYDEEADLDLNHQGIHTLKTKIFPDKTPSIKVVKHVENLISDILKDKKFPVLIGGEHTLSIGSLYAISKNFKNMSLLQLDAHTDLDPNYKKVKYHHASFARKVTEDTPIKITQVGIRSCIKEHLNFALKNNIDIFFAHNIINQKHKITDITKTLRNNVYISIDVDVFEPALFPFTGTPEPNGLKWQYIINLITEVAKTKNIIGLDIVEHAPGPNEKDHSSYSAAKLLNKVLSIIFKFK